jgi:integrase
LDFTDARGRRRRVVLSSDHRVAERRRADLIRRRDLELAGLGSEEGQSMPLAEIRDLYLADLRHHVGPRHLLNVELKLRRLLEELEAVRVRDVTPHAVMLFRDKLASEGLAHRTCNLYANTLRAMLRWAAEAGLIARNPIERLKALPEGPRHIRCKRRAMSEEEIQAFLAAAEEDDRRCEAAQANSRERRVQGRRLRVLDAEPPPRVPQAPFWRTLLETGARYGELQKLTWGDVDFAARLISLRAETTKGERSRFLPLREALLLELLDLRQLHGRVLGRPVEASDPVFLSPEGSPLSENTVNAMRIFDRLLEAAGIAREDANGAKLDIHALRHTLATRLQRSGVGLAQAQRILGHSDPKLTARIYTHLGVEDLRDAVESIPQEEPSRAPTREAQ